MDRIADGAAGDESPGSGRGACGGSAATLVEAIKNEDRAAVRALLQRRADVNALEPDGTTPLHWAAHMDDVRRRNC